MIFSFLPLFATSIILRPVLPEDPSIQISSKNNHGEVEAIKRALENGVVCHMGVEDTFCSPHGIASRFRYMGTACKAGTPSQHPHEGFFVSEGAYGVPSFVDDPIVGSRPLLYFLYQAPHGAFLSMPLSSRKIKLTISELETIRDAISQMTQLQQETLLQFLQCPQILEKSGPSEGLKEFSVCLDFLGWVNTCRYQPFIGGVA